MRDFQHIEEQANLGGGTAYYIYYAGGERVRKVIEKTGGIVEERVYLSGYEIFRKTVSGTLQFERETLHVSDNEKKIVSVETKTKENATSIQNPVPSIRYQYDNHLGSAALELDDTAAIISYEEYHPFGTTSYRSGRTETEVSLKRYKYVGKERDEETGLYYYGARYYAAWICRFVSVDPLQHMYPKLTPYHYTSNNPITFIDYDGNDFGVKVNHDDRTITIVANINTYTDRGYNQMSKAVEKWNSLSKTLDNGYTISFQLEAVKPKYSNDDINQAKREERKNNGKQAGKDKVMEMKLENRNVALQKTKSSNIDNLYLGNAVPNIKEALEFTQANPYETFYLDVNYENSTASGVGGFVVGGKYMTMAIWRDVNRAVDERDNSESVSRIWHEIGHFLGLDDKGGNYYGEDTIMDYSHIKFSENGSTEIDLIIKYAQDTLNVKNDPNANVQLIEEIGGEENTTKFKNMKF